MPGPGSATGVLLNGRGYWKNDDNIKNFVKKLGVDMEWKELDDYYQISCDMVAKAGGHAIQRRYSLIEMLELTFPEHEWLPWRMRCAPKGFFDDLENIRKYLSWLTLKLKYQNIQEAFDGLSDVCIRNNHGGGLMHKYKSSVKDVFSAAYPKENFAYARNRGARFSMVSIDWLEALQKKNGCKIQHALNGGEIRLPEISGKVDGYDESTKTVYEYSGCHVHGCPRCYHPDYVSPVTKRTAAEDFNSVILKRETILTHGYNYVGVWHCDYLRGEHRSKDACFQIDDKVFEQHISIWTSQFINFVQTHRRMPSSSSKDEKEAYVGLIRINYATLYRSNPSSSFMKRHIVDQLNHKTPHWEDFRIANIYLRAQDIIIFHRRHKRYPRENADDRDESILGKCLLKIYYNNCCASLKDRMAPIHNVLSRANAEWRDDFHGAQMREYSRRIEEKELAKAKNIVERIRNGEKLDKYMNQWLNDKRRGLRGDGTCKRYSSVLECLEEIVNWQMCGNVNLKVRGTTDKVSN